MHPNAVHSKLSAQLKEVEARTNARLDGLQSKLDRILQAAGLAERPRALDAPIDVEFAETATPEHAEPTQDREA